jgi:hypothetical protein
LPSVAKPELATATRGKRVAEARTATAVTAPPGVHFDTIEVQPEAPVDEVSD